jgi:putative phosphoesterase
MRVGLVSDTHGRFEPGLRELFSGCDLVLHAGDVVGRDVLALLAAIAPLTAVRGNNDVGELGVGLADEAVVVLGGLRALVIHELGRPDRPVPQARELIALARPQLVVYGHSHRPAISLEGGILYVNPGSAGPRRFRLPRTAGLLTVEGRRARVELFDLDQPGLPAFRPPVVRTL